MESVEKKLKEIAARIKELREIEGYSIEKMAELTNTTVQEYENFESGDYDFNFTFIHKCAKSFNVDPTDLLEGKSPTLSSYSVVRKGKGLPIARRSGFSYKNLAPVFKDKLAQPFNVTVPYSAEEENAPIKTSTHAGHELDIILKGSLKVRVGDHVETLNEGDAIYYDSLTPHGMVAAGGSDCEFYAIVLSPSDFYTENPGEHSEKSGKALVKEIKNPVYGRFINETVNENGLLTDISFKNEETFNFAFDILDALAEKVPDKTALIYLSDDKKEKRFTFKEMKEYSNKTANYFESLGIKRGDRVMLVLKRHYQFWFSIMALSKIGAIVIPATNLLVEHDFDYRFKAAGVKAIVCTADGETADHAMAAAKNCETVDTFVLVGEKRDGWHDFDSEFEAFSPVYERKADTACGSDPMLMFFTSGTTGYPKIAEHNHKYPLGHYVTARYWHNVDPDGIHFTISDTGWGKALWGKLYGQWMCETTVFVYDFNKFDAHEILPLFAKYNITTFCAPPTMYRFFIKEDLSKYDLSSLKYSTVAGEALNPEVYEQWKKATGLKLMEGFGQTETTLTVGNLVSMEPKPGSMGKPSPLYDVKILLSDGSEAPVGETGEVVVITKENTPCGLFMGYYLDDELTKEAWSDGVYHTGDTAWMDEDGYLWYVGRMDDVIKSSGYRIGPFEIESVIMELPYVLECAVTSAPDPVRGQVVKASIVLVKGTEGTDALKKEIQNYVKTHTAPYKYPRIVEFRDDLPKTISGKIRRVELKG